MKPFDEQVDGDHYRQGKIQPALFSEANEMSFLEGTVIKYITRYKYKNGERDLRKAIHAIELLIDVRYGPESQE